MISVMIHMSRDCIEVPNGHGTRAVFTGGRRPVSWRIESASGEVLVTIPASLLHYVTGGVELEPIDRGSQ